MNERIKLLAEQATIKTSHKYHTWGDRIATETKEVFDKEKFAELIVRECADVCYEHSFHAGGVDTAFGYGYKDCGDDIKRTFGVEE